MTALNDLMDFDSIVYSDGAGTVYRVDSYGLTIPFDRNVHEGVYTVGISGPDEDTLTLDEQQRLFGGELLRGLTGQYGYSGPCMHVSEYIGGGLETHIRSTPGYYYAVVFESEESCEQCEQCLAGETWECELYEMTPHGWGVVYNEDTELPLTEDIQGVSTSEEN